MHLVEGDERLPGVAAVRDRVPRYHRHVHGALHEAPGEAVRPRLPGAEARLVPPHPHAPSDERVVQGLGHREIAADSTRRHHIVYRERRHAHRCQ